MPAIRDRANAIIAASALDGAPAGWPAERFGGWRLDNLREITLHVNPGPDQVPGLLIHSAFQDGS